MRPVNQNLDRESSEQRREERRLGGHNAASSPRLEHRPHPPESEKNGPNHLGVSFNRPRAPLPTGQCRAALAAAFNDEARATQFLLEGIPAGAMQVLAATKEMACRAD